MRVTESMALRDFLNNLDGAREKMNEAQNKISTGRSILRPADDPRDMSDILRLKADKVESEQYERNLEWGRSRLDFADTARASIQDMIERVRFLGLAAIGSQTDSREEHGQLQGASPNQLRGNDRTSGDSDRYEILSSRDTGLAAGGRLPLAIRPRRRVRPNSERPSG
jgi:hypothetical protein